MAGTSATANTAIQAQINSLQETMSTGFRELKEILQGIEARVRVIETNEARCQPLTESRLFSVEKRVEEHDTKIGEITKVMAELASTNRILKYILGIFTAVLTAFLIAVATGKIALIMR